MQTQPPQHQHWNKSALDKLTKEQSIHLINAITGIKPANVIGSQDAAGHSNLAIFSSIVHMGSRPPVIGCILRPSINGNRHTYENIKQTGVYTINSVSSDWSDKAHYTSARFARNECEFIHCGLNKQYYDDFPAPFVQEAAIQIGLKLVEEIPIQINDTKLLIGEVVRLSIAEQGIDSDLQLNLEKLNLTGISGLNRYYKLALQKEYPIAKVGKLPQNKKEA
ncbi:flavin oxidoreductase [Thiosulfatimonas sediminis]|uniref:Flavin oxidoreductase n=1 Tax=Thiosulfatimonas sediminis TaxID=2675054 RepID=A0A6F8PWJ5_9GAMM|nr:flavin reductase family protein [Thiosulfatimonas sediminis]BBP46466.1 flavin oxidoreductase [Thiosulfatimonas sediminis]